MQYNPQQARQQWQNRVNNAQGHIFEDGIKAACRVYHDSGRAEVDKTPEPFRVTSKGRDGTFTGRFTALAAPDFQGTLQGGRSIVFEAKYTTADRMKRAVLTDAQMEALESHARSGAAAGVCAGIRDTCFFVPWNLWRDMKEHYGRLYVTAADLEPFRVRFTGAVLFLDYAHNADAAAVARNYIAPDFCAPAHERSVSNEKAAQAEINHQGNAANGVQS